MSPLRRTWGPLALAMTLPLLGLAWQPVHADRPSDEARLAARLGANTAREVMGVVETASAEGLPARPLVGRAFEAASRGGGAVRVLAAVREQLHALRAARGALGPASSETELTAGALALFAGIHVDSLSVLRLARGDAPLVVPLVVMSDLVARRVPVEAASNTVITAARGGVRDPDLLRLRERIDRQLERGAPPADAAAVELRVVLRQVNDRRTSGARGGAR